MAENIIGMKSIVVPVNFTAHSRNGARYAAEMALALEADIHLLYVEVIPMSPAEIPASYFLDEMQKSAEESMSELAAELTALTRRQVTVNIILDTGNLQVKLEEVCKRLKPFVVIMGIQTEPELRSTRASDTMNAVRHLTCPLLLIPANIRFHAIRKIAIACDPGELRDGMPVELSFLTELCELFSARLEIVHIAHPDANVSAVGAIRAGQWTSALPPLGPEIRVIEAGSVERGIAKFLSSHEADWLIVFPRQYRFPAFHRSHSIRIVRDCAIPVLSIGERMVTD